ncbi:hypothetical protein [Alistipes onderdonkii]|uniref:hypothetical protein n=1 Tax=Alistipes onderdonkii TaxID=328813 RepID=UPI00050A017F|nr:hypothetical protein [Alistipes onderdonkii]
MNIEEILSRVDNVKPESNYWFVRTDYGKYFEEFVENRYIAIGWDFLSLYELENKNEEYIRAKIIKEEEIDVSTFGGKVKVSTIYNKIKTFISLKKDDVVIIPSKNSDELAFGRIIDERAYENGNVKEFRKQRKVEWFVRKCMRDLNPIFFKVKSNQHTISNITDYAPHIDRVMGVLFKKNDKTHYVLNIENPDDIKYDDLEILMRNIKTLVRNINNEFDFNENLDEFYVKISLQSKGSLELIKTGKSLVIFAFVLSLISCRNNNDPVDDKIQKFMQENEQILSKTDEVITNLKINTQEIIEPFINEHGN